MKKIAATFCLLGATLALSACSSTTKGDADMTQPYSMERTATYSGEMPAATPSRVAPAEKVFRRAQTK
ncbi:MAG: lipoprotein [Alphaproteobacteria bacterium]|nr:lipoprotein [Alphaproteobacteria bacterium]